MRQITLVTGNLHKLAELQAVFPAEANLTHAKLDIDEIQGENADPHEILEDKLKKAYAIVKAPVVVEDVSAELDCLNGLPGPFVKFFEKKLGKAALWILAKNADDKGATMRCVMGYYDGSRLEVVDGTVAGTIVAPRGENGFGFDFVFVPEGYDRTTAEMTAEEKNKISWRGLAARELADRLFTSD